MRLHTYLFARLYGYMLGRATRNTPREACQDAIGPFMILTGVPTTLALIVLVTAVAPNAITGKAWIPWVVIPSGVLLYIASRPLLRYSRTPDIAARFCSPASRRTTMAGYLFALLSSVIIAGIAARALKP
jgi:hypothetical protein